MQCTGSEEKSSVSDYNVITRKAHCPVCGKVVKITIPDRKMHSNIAKFAKHVKAEGEGIR